MKTNKEKKVTKKFDLEKMNVAKLKNMHLINGGNADDDNVNTVTDSTKIVIKISR